MKNNQSALRSDSFYLRVGLATPTHTLFQRFFHFLFHVFHFLAYVLALCIFQTFHLWIGNLIYAAFIVLFPFFLGFLCK